MNEENNNNEVSVSRVVTGIILAYVALLVISIVL